MLLIYFPGLSNHQDPKLPKINEVFIWDLYPIYPIWEYSPDPGPIYPTYNTTQTGGVRSTYWKDYWLLFS